jgi:hypothetical protein
MLLHAIIHSAGVQDRDGGILLLATLFGQFPLSRENCSPTALIKGRFSPRRSLHSCLVSNRDRQTIRSGETIREIAQALHRRTDHAWMNRCRRLARDWENLNRTALAFLKLAAKAL